MTTESGADVTSQSTSSSSAAPAVDRQPVQSSLIKSIGYAHDEMHIEFNNGRVYSYTGPKVEEHYKGVLSAAAGEMPRAVGGTWEKP